MLAGLAAATAVTGCTKPQTPAEAIGYYLRPDGTQNINRVVFVEFARDNENPRIADEATNAMLQAIQNKKLFHIEVIKRTNPACQDLNLNKSQAYTLEELAAMSKTLKCDAILLGRVDRFQPYPRMMIGLYMQLLDLKQGNLVWAVDHVWDTTDKQTEERIKKYFGEVIKDRYEPIDWELAIMSPRAFLKYVAYEAAATLVPPPAEKQVK